MPDLIRREELENLDLSDVSTGRKLPPVPPGEVLRVEFMEPGGLSARGLARGLGVPPNRITEILNGERAITADTAIRFGHHFGTTAEFWMNLQTQHDLEEARRAKSDPLRGLKDAPTRTREFAVPRMS